MRSMTGYARAAADNTACRAEIELRSVNHRFLEVETRLPEGLGSTNAGRSSDGKQGHEETVRAMASKIFRRGRVRISVNIRTNESAAPIVFESKLAKRYVSQLKKMKRELGLPGAVSLEMVLGLPQVVTVSKMDLQWGKIWPQIRQGVAQALSQTGRMRRREGARLAKQLLRFVGALDQLTREVKRRVPIVERTLTQRLAKRIQEAARTVGAAKVEKDFVLAEAASYVQSSDIREELDRIDSHLTALRQALRGEAAQSKTPALAGSPGRTIDFLAQELHREVNTLGAKMRDGVIVRLVIAMKGQIEKLREQAANVE